jgi:hypothetical protein
VRKETPNILFPGMNNFLGIFGTERKCFIPARSAEMLNKDETNKQKQEEAAEKRK